MIATLGGYTGWEVPVFSSATHRSDDDEHDAEPGSAAEAASRLVEAGEAMCETLALTTKDFEEPARIKWQSAIAETREALKRVRAEETVRQAKEKIPRVMDWIAKKSLELEQRLAADKQRTDAFFNNLPEDGAPKTAAHHSATSGLC
jgi:hypothetical protein